APQLVPVDRARGCRRRARARGDRRSVPRGGAVLTVRPATAADETAALDLLEELFAAPASRAPGDRRERAAAAFHDAVATTDADVLLAVDDGRAVGLASVYVDI